MSHHTQTFGPTPGTYTITLTGSIHNFRIDNLVSGGGNGDNSPAQGGGFADNGSPGGGGGGRITNVPIPDGELLNASVIQIIVGSSESSSSVTVNGDQSGFLEVSVGENGSTCSGLGDQVEGGKLTNDFNGWVTDPDTMFSEGAPSTSSDNQDQGYGGGSAGGVSGQQSGNTNGGGQGGGASPVTGSGAGGNGGNTNTNGSAGSNPGGGGGGAGLGTGKTGGAGGNSVVTMSWDDGTPVIPPTILNTPNFSVSENTTAVDVILTSGSPPITFSITGGTDQAKFAIDTDGLLSFLVAPNFEIPTDANTDNVYLVQVTATNADGSSVINCNVTVTDVAEGSSFNPKSVAGSCSLASHATIPNTPPQIFQSQLGSPYGIF